MGEGGSVPGTEPVGLLKTLHLTHSYQEHMEPPLTTIGMYAAMEETRMATPLLTRQAEHRGQRESAMTLRSLNSPPHGTAVLSSIPPSHTWQG